MWYQRDISDYLKMLSQSFPALVLTGARQVGKTSLLTKLFPDHQLVSLDLPSRAELADKNPAAFLKKYQTPLLIDEVQYAPHLFRYLKINIDENRKIHGQYVLTGSQQFNLMKEVSESLAGRCGVCQLDTLSLKEIELQNSQNSLESLVLKGGYPELHVPSNLSTDMFFSSYVATYLERDVRSQLRVSSLRDFERFMRACSLRAGNLLNMSEISRDVGIKSPTVSEWLSVLQASHQIFFVEPWFENKTKSLIKSPKLYFSDTGLLCFLAGIFNEEDLVSSPLKGAIWENFVISELRKRTFGREKFWFYAEKSGLEVDLLVHRGGRFELLEIKWSENPTKREAKNLQTLIERLGKEKIMRSLIICRTQESYQLSTQVPTDVVSLREL